jgi:hypothetical protein
MPGLRGLSASATGDPCGVGSTGLTLRPQVCLQQGPPQVTGTRVVEDAACTVMQAGLTDPTQNAVVTAFCAATGAGGGGAGPGPTDPLTWKGGAFRDPKGRYASASDLFKTAPNEAFFWSGNTGGIGGEKVARQIAQDNGGVTLEILREQRSGSISWPDWVGRDPSTIVAWNRASLLYARGASGDVRVVLGENVRADSVWEKTELPALTENPRVTKVTAIDPATGAERVIYER